MPRHFSRQGIQLLKAALSTGLIAVPLALTLVQCQQDDEQTNPFIHLTRSEEDALLKTAHVIQYPGRVEGMDRMHLFMSHVDSGTSDSIRIIAFTIEGVPIVQDLSYNGSEFAVKFDYGRDNYSGTKDFFIKHYREISVSERDGAIEYVLKPASGESYSLIWDRAASNDVQTSPSQPVIIGVQP